MIAHIVAVGVVDPLEVIDVGKHESKGSPAPFGTDGLALDLLLDRVAFGLKIAGDGFGKTRIGHPVQRMGLRRQISARQFVFALRARLEQSAEA